MLDIIMWECQCKFGTRMKSVRSGQYKPCIEILTGRRVERLYIVLILCAILGLIAVGMYYHSKNKTVDQICNHPELSDDKVKSIACMMTKQHKKFFLNNN